MKYFSGHRSTVGTAHIMGRGTNKSPMATGVHYDRYRHGRAAASNNNNPRNNNKQKLTLSSSNKSKSILR